MRENLEVFDFELTDDEVKQITKLDKGHTCFMPRNTGKAVSDFLTIAVSGSAPSGVVKK